jgi:hypothetical protein
MSGYCRYNIGIQNVSWIDRIINIQQRARKALFDKGVLQADLKILEVAHIIHSQNCFFSLGLCITLNGDNRFNALWVKLG